MNRSGIHSSNRVGSVEDWSYCSSNLDFNMDNSDTVL